MTKALPRGLELTYDPQGLDTVRVSIGFYEALSLLRDIAFQLHPGGDAVILMLSGWLQECQDEREYHKHKAGHLRLLEAVAEAAVGYVRERNCLISMPLTIYLSKYSNMMDNGERTLVEVLIALEALDEKEQP